MLQLRNITKTYKVGNGQVVALDNINIDFPDKGIVFVVGKSGSGKSTLLNILGGLDKMDCGEIIIDGKSTNDFLIVILMLIEIIMLDLFFKNLT